jgi:hypothetical protein
VFSAKCARAAPSASNWFYDIGTGHGTGEIEQKTSSTNNVYLDGNGHFVLKAIDNDGSWTSARVECEPFADVCKQTPAPAGPTRRPTERPGAGKKIRQLKGMQ